MKGEDYFTRRRSIKRKVDRTVVVNDTLEHSKHGDNFIRVKFVNRYRKFRKGKTIKFKKGLNLLVGENGSGKSSLLNVMRTYFLLDHGINIKNTHKYVVDESEMDIFNITHMIDYNRFFDYSSDSDNPRMIRGFQENMRAFFEMNIYDVMRSSFGEGQLINLNDMLTELLEDKVGGNIILLDEPDLGLSIKNRIKFSKIIEFLSKNNTIIMSSHSERMLNVVDNVYNMDKQKWVKINDYKNDLFTN